LTLNEEDPTERPDLHQRFVEVCSREVVHHAEHLAAVKALDLPAPSRRGVVVRVPLDVTWEPWGQLWTCPTCRAVYLVRGGAPRCQRCP
jgi:hypothetical protein